MHPFIGHVAGRRRDVEGIDVEGIEPAVHNMKLKIVLLSVECVL